MTPWHFGNTTVRSPFRLRDGLLALSGTSLEGNLRGVEQDAAFRIHLGNKEVVGLGTDPTNSVGRKWRSALEKLGFLYPKVPSGAGIKQADLGAVDTITKNGHRLVRADSVFEIQECFLRSLAAYFIPLEPKSTSPRFSPLRHTLKIMLELDKRCGTSAVHFIEMALVVQMSNPSTKVKELVDELLDLRRKREASSRKKKFDNSKYEAAGEKNKYVPGTFRDYADVNIRYLKATGLVQSKGRGIELAPEQRVLCESLAADEAVPATEADYLRSLCDGAHLPTDNRDEALMVLQNLIEQLKLRNIPFDDRQLSRKTVADISLLRYKARNLLFESNEIEFAVRQAEEWEEIVAYMQMLSKSRFGRRELGEGHEINIPKDESAAYFEWVLWRAFLAIDSLVNRPYEARRFKADQDFLPIGTAPGNGPDLVFEFADFVLVVEVTLTSGSRQEAVEGESVRRHVANIALSHKKGKGKSVFGLFLANQIDPNTAETFRHGSWYYSDRDKLCLSIVPVTLEQFCLFFEAMFRSRSEKVKRIKMLLEECGQARKGKDAPAWKEAINEAIIKQICAVTGRPA